MEQNKQGPEVYDFRQYDHIWERVAPGLEPYPTPRQEGTAPAISPAASVQEPARVSDAAPSLQTRQESMLPGAEPNPCCMGTAAAEMLNVLVGFIEEELGDQRVYQAMTRQAPSWARQRMREMAAAEGEHAKRLMAVYYLITGECYRPVISTDRICLGRWCAALRERYHAAACNGMNYVRAAEGTTDPCLSRLLKGLGAEEDRHADMLLGMLQRSLRG